MATPGTPAGSGVDIDHQREWLSFEDPDEHRTWLFDVTFLTSNWTCIYGAGCPGIEVDPAPERQLGCCTHGAYLSDDDDLAHVRRCIEELDDSRLVRSDFDRGEPRPTGLGITVAIALELLSGRAQERRRRLEQET